MLDVRGAVDADWSSPEWPDLEVLILRWGRADAMTRWVADALARRDVIPRLVELRVEQEELVEVVARSPVLPYLTRIDFTDALTNTGAKTLHEHANLFAHVAELLVGDTGRRRSGVEAVGRARGDFVAPPRGELEVDDAWRSRLKQRFGARLHFDARRGYPDL